MNKAIIAIVLLLAGWSEASAQSRCRVMDPTGTPLNVRSSPNGTVVGSLRNGTLVTILDRSRDRQGRSWVYIGRYRSGQSVGWVYREFIACF